MHYFGLIILCCVMCSSNPIGVRIDITDVILSGLRGDVIVSDDVEMS